MTLKGNDTAGIVLPLPFESRDDTATGPKRRGLSEKPDLGQMVLRPGPHRRNGCDASRRTGRSRGFEATRKREEGRNKTPAISEIAGFGAGGGVEFHS